MGRIITRYEALNLILGFISTILLTWFNKDLQRTLLTFIAIFFYTNALRLLLQRTKNGN